MQEAAGEILSTIGGVGRCHKAQAGIQNVGANGVRRRIPFRTHLRIPALCRSRHGAGWPESSNAVFGHVL